MPDHRTSSSCPRKWLRTGSPWRSVWTARSSSQKSSQPASAACAWPASAPVSTGKPSPSTCRRLSPSTLCRPSAPSTKYRERHLLAVQWKAKFPSKTEGFAVTARLVEGLVPHLRKSWRARISHEREPSFYWSWSVKRPTLLLLHEVTRSRKLTVSKKMCLCCPTPNFFLVKFPVPVYLALRKIKQSRLSFDRNAL